jgi:hypothetical protein
LLKPPRGTIYEYGEAYSPISTPFLNGGELQQLDNSRVAHDHGLLQYFIFIIKITYVYYGVRSLTTVGINTNCEDLFMHQ